MPKTMMYPAIPQPKPGDDNDCFYLWLDHFEWNPSLGILRSYHIDVGAAGLYLSDWAGKGIAAVPKLMVRSHRTGRQYKFEFEQRNPLDTSEWHWKPIDKSCPVNLLVIGD